MPKSIARSRTSLSKATNAGSSSEIGFISATSRTTARVTPPSLRCSSNAARETGVSKICKPAEAALDFTDLSDHAQVVHFVGRIFFGPFALGHREHGAIAPQGFFHRAQGPRTPDTDRDRGSWKQYRCSQRQEREATTF